MSAYEDGRFWEHRGVDTRALLRAALQWMWRGHLVSGGSTLSMQVARLIAVPIHARGCEFSNQPRRTGRALFVFRDPCPAHEAAAKSAALSTLRRSGAGSREHPVDARDPDPQLSGNCLALLALGGEAQNVGRSR